MANLGEIAVQISADISKFNVGIKSALTSIDAFGKQVSEQSKKANNSFKSSMSNLGSIMQSNGKKMQEVGGTMMKFVTLPLIGAGFASIKFASDMNETMNKVSVIFGNNAKEVERWSKTSIQKMGLASQTALDSAALYGDMATSMGFGTDQAANMGMGLTQLGADLASFKNIPVGQAMNALSGVFTGETESLKSLGIIMTQTNLDAYAMANGYGKTTDKMSQAEQVALRYAYILDKTKNAQGDFARTSGGTANQTRMLWQNIKQLGATVGKYLLPAFTYVVKKINGFLTAMNGISPILMKVIIGLAFFAAIIPPIIFAIGTISLMMPVFAAGLEIVSGAVASLGTAMLSLLANPVTWIVLAIVGLVAVAWYMWKNWDTVSVQLKMAIESVGYVFKQTWSWIKTMALYYVYGIVSIWGFLIGWIPGLGKVFKKVKGILKDALDSEQEQRSQNKLQHTMKQTALSAQLQQARLKKQREEAKKSKDKTKSLSDENKKLKDNVDDSTKSIKKQIGALAGFDQLNLTDISKKIKDATTANANQSATTSSIKIPEIKVPDVTVKIKSFSFADAWESFKKSWMNSYNSMGNWKLLINPFDVKQGEKFGADFWRWFDKGWKSMGDFFTKAFTLNKEQKKALNDMFSGIGSELWKQIKSGWGSFKDLFGVIQLPHFKMVNWSKNPLNWIEKPPYIDVKWFANGGVFSKPSLVGMGERGKEAIVPLERNLGWADNVASMLDARMSGGGSPTINVSVGGQHIGTIASQQMSRLNRQAGKTIIPL